MILSMKTHSQGLCYKNAGKLTLKSIKYLVVSGSIRQALTFLGCVNFAAKDPTLRLKLRV